MLKLLVITALLDIRSLLCVEPILLDSCSLSSGNYHSWRCQSGVGEGVTDFPPSQSFPLEGNLDFMNGGTALNNEFLELNFLYLLPHNTHTTARRCSDIS